jgi:hypothetical protein
MQIPIASARYNRRCVVEFNSDKTSKEFFYLLNKLAGYDASKRRYMPGTGLDWALRRLSPKKRGSRKST